MGLRDKFTRVKEAWNTPVKPEQKDVYNTQLIIGESERGGRHKAYIPMFLWKPPFGYPRYQNINEIRSFAKTPHVWMAVDTVATECAMMEWDIRVKPEALASMTNEQAQAYEQSLADKKQHVMSFFKNPNTNKEGYYSMVYKLVVDTLEVNAGVLVKVFDIATMGGSKPRLVELIPRDGGTFLKNPDMHGMFTRREEFVDVPQLTFSEYDSSTEVYAPSRNIPSEISKEAAYYQYGYQVAMRAVPFGKRELIWIEKTPRTDTLYGPSPVEIALTIIKVLLYGTEDMLQYYVDNNVPKGAFSLKGATKEQMNAFKEQWFNQQHDVNNLNQQVKKYWQMPFTNQEMEFVRFQFSPAELELISQQQWLSKLLWALIKISPSELGFTEDSNRATEKGQEIAHKRKALDPYLKLLEYHFNSEIMPEFGPEYQDLEFYYPEHDLDKEQKQTDIHAAQIKNGIKTVNEVRQELGLEPVSYGDEPPKNFNSSVEDELSAAMNDEQRRDDLKAAISNYLSPAPSKSKQSVADSESKALDTEAVIIPREGERVTETEVESVINDMLSDIEKEALELYKEMIGSQRKSLSEIKSIGDRIKKALEGAVSFQAIKSVITRAVRQEFVEGHEDVEEALDRNFVHDKGTMEFLEQHTFDNVKGLADDSITKLRGVLERGFIDNKSPDSVAKDIQKALGVEKPRSQAIARTEMTRARNAGFESTIKKNGIKGKFRWRASGDRSSDRATKLCTQLDGQEVDVGENFKGSAAGLSFEGPRPPAHVNCRSRLEFVPDLSPEE